MGATGPRLAEHFAGLGQRGLDAGEHDRRVEVALDGEATDPLSGLAERHPPVDADHVGAGLGEQAEQLAGANTEVHAGHVEVGQLGEDPLGGGQHVAAVVGGREGAGPGIEQLHRPGAGVHLGADRGDGQVAKGLHQVEPEGLVTEHQGFGGAVGARRAPLDQVAGHGERGAGEADQRDIGGRDDRLDRLEYVRGIRLRVEGAETAEVGPAAKRLFDHRPDARHDVDVHPDGVDRGNDVAEEHGGVHPVAAYRLQRDLGGQLRLEDGFGDRSTAPHRPVLGQRTAGLTLEPDRHPIGTAATGGFQKR